MVNRMMMGLHGGVWKFRISKPGIDVLTASLDNCAMHELLQMGQIRQYGEFYLPTGTGTRSVVINFTNDGYIPQVYYSTGYGFGNKYRTYPNTDAGSAMGQDGTRKLTTAWISALSATQVTFSTDVLWYDAGTDSYVSPSATYYTLTYVIMPRVKL